MTTTEKDDSDFMTSFTSANMHDLLATLDEANVVGAMTSMHDSEGNYTYVSRQSFGLLGYKPYELVGLNAWELIHPDDHPDTRVAQWTVQSNEPTRIKYRLRHKDGTWVPVESIAWESDEFGTVVVTRRLVDDGRVD